MHRKLMAASLALASLLASGTPRADGGTISGKVDATPPKYLPDTVVYLKSVPGTFPPKAATMDQKGLKFSPAILTVTQGDTVKFLNHDSVAHNVYSPDGEAYNLGTFKPEQEASYTFKKTGTYTQLCSIHPEMLGYIFVGQNPYSAVVDSKGEYVIKEVPPGTYQLAVWNADKLKAPEKGVTVTAGQTAQENISIKR
jgi:plastocyanin